MRIHCIIHEHYEGIGCIKEWINLKNYKVSFTLTFCNENFPHTSAFDWLIIMGGGMSVYEEKKYPHLKKEKEFIKKAIKEDKTVLGICLGSQFLAEVLGGKVYPGSEKEIGWFPVKIIKENLPDELKGLPAKIMAFHWHGDTYDLPKKTVHIASSAAIVNQGFLYGEKVLALQYHYEVDEKAVGIMLKHSENELSENGKYIQTKEQILKGLKYVKENNEIMFMILDYLESKTVLK